VGAVGVLVVRPTRRALAEEADEAVEKACTCKGMRDVNSNVREGDPDLQVVVDGGRAARLGMSAEAVRRQLEAMYLGTVAPPAASPVPVAPVLSPSQK
jgi:multidrug efflux pump subunit AcrB